MLRGETSVYLDLNYRHHPDFLGLHQGKKLFLIGHPPSKINLGLKFDEHEKTLYRSILGTFSLKATVFRIISTFNLVLGNHNVAHGLE